jgi:hypothetical protein
MRKIILSSLILLNVDVVFSQDHNKYDDLIKRVLYVYGASCSNLHEENPQLLLVEGAKFGTAFARFNIKKNEPPKLGLRAKIQALCDEHQSPLVQQKAAGISSYFSTEIKADDMIEIDATMIVTSASKPQAGFKVEDLVLEERPEVIDLGYAKGSVSTRRYYDEEFERIQKTIIVKCKILQKLSQKE